MEDLGMQTYCQRAALELVALITHQRRPRGRQRRDSALLRRFVTEVLSGSPAAERLQGGPWKVGTRPLKKPGRGGLSFIPLVQRGGTVVMMSTPQEAEELVAFLNYCGMDEFTKR
ncbi:MAG TPA: hypothetical protein VMY76_05820 [Gemmatimonadales bacterium]|nr:hypothetical protein [Gemmatimonadales bacterium]